MPSQLIFLPGASGRTELWLPVASRLTHPAKKIQFGWPGFGSVPPDPQVKGIDGLVAKLVTDINQPTALIAQSMGGVVAIRAALEKPNCVTHLVLSVTSGGIDMSGFCAQDWRPSFHEENPSLPRWFSSYQEDMTDRLSGLHIPTLLLWGDADPISPARVGQRLASILPLATLHVFSGGEHDLVRSFAADIAPLIDEHLTMLVRPT